MLKKKIVFTQGLPDLSEDLGEINPEYNNILVFDDLMSQATDSLVLSQLFTQGRHRNASVILLLQNMFLKGKFNTDISRNALYKVLFRSPGDRKQGDIMAEQTFAKDRANFMKAYTRETGKPFGYIILDNHPRTTNENQVVANVFGDCYTCPRITKTDAPLPQSTASRETIEHPKLTVKRKVDLYEPSAKQPKTSTVKRKVKNVNKRAKKSKKSSKPKTQKPRKQTKRQRKNFTGGFQELSSNEEPRHCTMDELNELARQGYLATQRGGLNPSRHRQNGFGR